MPAAARHEAVAQAAVHVSVAVIAGFTLVDVRPAALEATPRAAAITGLVVAVIAGFAAGAGDAVTAAAARQSLVQSSVPLVLPSSQASPASTCRCHRPLAGTHRRSRLRRRCCRRRRLKTGLLVGEVGGKMPSPQRATAGGGEASRFTVAIVADLLTCPDLSIAADRRAGVQAGVGVVGVAVIAALAGLHDPATAGRGLAVGAVVGRVCVAIVAALARTDDPVTASCLNAGA